MRSVTGAAAALLLLLLLLCGAAYGDYFRPTYCGQEPGTPRTLPPAPAGAGTLTQVQVLFRHGDRTIAGDSVCWLNDPAVYTCNLTYLSLPNNDLTQTTVTTSRIYRRSFLPGRNYFPGDCETGQLTDIGMQQEIDNGKMLAAAYVGGGSKLLPAAFDATQVWTRSDNEDRTVQSAQSVLLGLYPPAAAPAPGGAIQVLDIWSMDPTLDDVTPNPLLCPLLGALYTEAGLSPQYQELNQTQLLPLLAKLETVFDSPMPYLQFSGGHIFDCINVHLCHNLPGIPDAFSQDLYDAVEQSQVTIWNFTNGYPSREAGARAGIGFLLEEQLQRMAAVVNGSQASPKLYLWSGHDTSVLPWLLAFGVNPGGWPPYASTIVMELYQQGEQQFAVRIIYNAEEILIPGCPDVLCPFDIFQALAQNLIYTNIAQDCAIPADSLCSGSWAPADCFRRRRVLSNAMGL